MESSDLAMAAMAMKNDLLEAIANDNYVTMKKIVYSIQTIISIDHSEFYNTLLSLGIEKLVKSAMGKLNSWVEAVQQGDVIEVYDEKRSTWNVGKVKNREGFDIDVHYLGWDAKWDETCNLREKHISPCYIFTKPKKVQEKKKEKPPHFAIVLEDIKEDITISSTILESEIDHTKRAGRKSKGDAPVVEPEKKRRKTESREKDDNDWICSICSMYESEDGSDLMMCDGSCHRSFHMGCLTVPPNLEDEYWFCSECLNEVHTCFVCGKVGEDYEEVNKCSSKSCGKFYHRECLENPNSTFLNPVIEDATKDVPLKGQLGQWATAARRSVDTFVFKCPYHQCDTCWEFHGKARHDELNKCIVCPRAFHTNCIPPGSRFTSICVLCPLHPELALPDQPGGLFNRPVVTDDFDEGLLVPTTTERKVLPPSGSISLDFFQQLLIPELIPDAANPLDNHFKLLTSIKDDTENIQQGFKYIHRNDYSTLTSKVPDNFMDIQVCCECKVTCDENCLNRVSRVECCDIKANRNNDQICNVGAHCGNRQLQNREYAAVEVFREFNRGWGLRAKNDIKRGDLIIEYVGEVIDFAEVVRRMSHQSTHTPSDHDFYIMELDSGIYVDGKFKGNNSRFINHSCGPNCELQRWECKGQRRIAIVAIKDVAAGEAFCYDYQFDTNEASTFQCFCGSENCRGTMAPRDKNDKNGANGIPTSKAERSKLIAAGRSMELKTYDMLLDEEANRSYTGKFIPGDPLNEMKNGPVRSTFGMANDCKAFLVRNVKQSLNMLDRKHALLD